MHDSEFNAGTSPIKVGCYECCREENQKVVFTITTHWSWLFDKSGFGKKSNSANAEHSAQLRGQI